MLSSDYPQALGNIIGYLVKINELQGLLLGEGSLQEKLKKVTDGVVKIFNADFARIWVCNPGDLCSLGCIHANPRGKQKPCGFRCQCLHLVASSGRYTHIDGPHSRMPFDLYKLGRIAVEEVNKFLTNDVVNDPQIMDHKWARELGLVSFAGYKLQNTAGEPIGVLALFSKQPILSDENILLEGIAGATSQVVQSGKAQEELHRSQGHLRTLIDAAPNVILHLSPEGEILEFNPEAERIYGCKKEEVLGKNYFELFLSDEARKIVIADFKKVLSGKSTRSFENLIKSAEGKDLFFSWDVERIVGQNGDPIGVVTIGQDITERKRAKEELLRLNNHLMDNNKELQQIINIASHDLQSPLRNIQGFTKELEKSLQKVASILSDNEISSSIKKKLAPLIEIDIPEERDYILASSSKMGTLVSGLLKVSRLGCVKLVITQFDMNKLFSNIVKSLAYNFKEKGVKLEIGELPLCRGDAVLIDQVFSNLLDNALKYLSSNRPGIIKISGQRKMEQVEYCIEDNGIGISAKHQKKVFEIFYRLDPKFGTGEGLGLSIVNKAMMRLGGKVWIESEPDKGSKFFVSLPA